jgi:hypothetical protein
VRGQAPKLATEAAMKRYLHRFVLGTTLCILAVTILYAQSSSRGTWTAEFRGDQPDRIHLQMQRALQHSNMGSDFKLTDFHGLDQATINGSNVPVKFELVRDAGTISFMGEFNKGLGHGEFNFTANPQYISEMKSMGYPDVEDKAWELTALDVSRAYAKELRDLGYKTDLKELIEARIFNVNRAQVEGLKSVGVTDLSLKKLVEYQIFKVTPDYVRQMRAAYPSIDMDQLVAMRIHGATPEFAQEMAKLGYTNLSAQDLINFRIHGVSPEFVHEMAGLGLKNLSAEQLVQFRIFGVGPEQINDLAKEGYKNLQPDTLVQFKIHGVDSQFIEKVKRAGHAHATPDQLINYKILGIRQGDDEI